LKFNNKLFQIYLILKKRAIMKNVNLELELKTIRDKEKNSDLLLQVEKILLEDEISRNEISY
jgi:ABC-type ATPase involved in cell division